LSQPFLFTTFIIPTFKTIAQETGLVTKMAQIMTNSLRYLQLTDQLKIEAMSLNTTGATGLVQTPQKAKADTSLIKTHFKKILMLFINLLLMKKKSFNNCMMMKQTTAAIKLNRKSGSGRSGLN